VKFGGLLLFLGLFKDNLSAAQAAGYRSLLKVKCKFYFSQSYRAYLILLKFLHQLMHKFFKGCIKTYINHLNFTVLTNITLGSSNSALPEDGDYTGTCWSCFNVNFNNP
jgi:hypothetical protein